MMAVLIRNGNFYTSSFLSPSMDGLQIPPDLEDTLLPSTTTPVALLATFHIPPIQITPSIASSLSDQLPTTTIEHLTHRATPPAADVQHLHSLFLRQNGSVHSILVARPGRDEDPPHYPVWALSYWLRLDVVREAKREWATAMRHLDGINQRLLVKKTEETAGLLDRVHDTLQMLPWAGTISSFSTKLQSVYLAAYLSTQWLSCEHEEQMLSLLSSDLAMAGFRASVIIEGTQFMEQLRSAYKHKDIYDQSSGYKWVRERGKEMADGTRTKLSTIAHTGGQHWVALIFDFENSIIYFGDSLRGEMISEIHKSVMRKLPITHQLDGFSCGLLSWNALCVFLLSDVSLFSVSTACVHDERMKIFLRVIERHNNESYNEINSSTSVAPTYISEDGDEDISGFDDSRPEPSSPLVPPRTSSPSTMQPLSPFYTSPASPMQVDLPSRQTTPSMPCDATSGKALWHLVHLSLGPDSPVNLRGLSYLRQLKAT
ncbi:hypothetical protein BDZ89DRAFT_1040400 [Hymenopellis radicata]|nr:hypothetical protein BDZ89DRAFT_1040400 [Hymenopellis radicata]